MPIWLRKYTFHEIREYYEAESKANEISTNPGSKTLIDSSGKVNVPEFASASKVFTPSYSTKASKK